MTSDEEEPVGNKATNLIWIDLEMTGLDTSNDQIIEVATIVTDDQLNEIAVGPELVIGQPREIIEGMDEWNTRQHGESGLSQRVLESDRTVTDAEADTLRFLQQYVDAGKSPMCGNSICQDRRFMARLMPDLETFFHYRNLDVSSLKELATRWAPKVAKGFKKSSSHLAMDDTKDSIRELQHYREHFIKLPE